MTLLAATPAVESTSEQIEGCVWSAWRRTTVAERSGPMEGGAHPEDAELIRRWLETRDEDACGAFVARYVPRLQAYFRQRGAHENDLGDLVSSTIVRAMQSLARFDRTRPVWPWLNKIAEREWADHLDRMRKLPKSELTNQLLAKAMRDLSTSNVSASQTDEHIEKTKRALARLSDRDRDILTRRYVANEPRSQIAAELGIDDDAVRMRIFRARRRFVQTYRRLGSPPNREKSV